jgi:hypothetical protein
LKTSYGRTAPEHHRGFTEARAQIQLDLRHRGHQPATGGLFEKTLLVIDGTACKVERPASDPHVDKLFYSKKDEFHAVKYLVGVGITSGLISFVSEPFPGSVHDKLMLDVCGLPEQLSEGSDVGRSRISLQLMYICVYAGEWVLADSGFIGSPIALVPIKKKKGQKVLLAPEKTFNDLISHVRSMVEHQFARFKRYRCLSTPWRESLFEHYAAFKAVSRMVQLDLLHEAFHAPHPAVILPSKR